VLQGEGKSQGVYDFCVVAHNGKCANRCVLSDISVCDQQIPVDSVSCSTLRQLQSYRAAWCARERSLMMLWPGDDKCLDCLDLSHC
jgi:hypothetical protein